MLLKHLDGRIEVLRAGTPQTYASVRTPGGHPEGYLEAFANLYRDFAKLLRGEPGSLLPGLADGLRGMAFVDTAVRASASQSGWVALQCDSGGSAA